MKKQHCYNGVKEIFYFRKKTGSTANYKNKFAISFLRINA